MSTLLGEIVFWPADNFYPLIFDLQYLCCIYSTVSSCEPELSTFKKNYCFPFNFFPEIRSVDSFREGTAGALLDRIPDYPQVRLVTVIHWDNSGNSKHSPAWGPHQLQTRLRLWAGVACRLTTGTDRSTLGESAWEKNESSTQKWGKGETGLFFKWVLEGELEEDGLEGLVDWGLAFNFTWKCQLTIVNKRKLKAWKQLRFLLFLKLWNTSILHRPVFNVV